jgi:hypothetical protein
MTALTLESVENARSRRARARFEVRYRFGQQLAGRLFGCGIGRCDSNSIVLVDDLRPMIPMEEYRRRLESRHDVGRGQEEMITHE